MDWKPIQKRLGVTEDGIAGPRTYAALFSKVSGRGVDDRLLALGKGAVAYFPGLIDTTLRLANFIGQTCVESGNYRYMKEIWGPTDTQLRYEGRADLDNNQPGDGKRFMGRGLLQITGRANYTAVGKRLGLDLVNHPELAEQPDIAIATACDYWRAHNLNQWADADNVLALSRAINCGNPNSPRQPNGYAERQVMTAKARVLLTGGNL